uniref:JmjC domain-containing protein n=1 Tax=Anopheles quadriannulatus TaxID=34691 RepID=A0A1Y9J175_ANOQN
MDPAKLKHIILNARHPYVVSNADPDWDCFRQSFAEWCEAFDLAHPDCVPFEGCPVKGGNHPQWEWERTKVKMKMRDICTPTDTRWNSFSYRNIALLPEPCRRGINFACFGFPEVEQDVTFWIGSAQAHTPCHYDTYGCNVVVQVFGRKSWILLPPDAKLTPVRVPFEESSVYCEENFYSPASYGPFTAVEDKVYHVVLEPGMALIVPPKWWHYVETLEPALNFNTWLGLETDVDSLISECITKLLLQDLCSDVPERVTSRLINPNEDLPTTEESVSESYQILNYLLNQRRNNKRQSSNLKRYPCEYLPIEIFGQLVDECKPFIKPVELLDRCDFNNLINRNRARNDPSYMDKISDELTVAELERIARLRKMVNVCCKPDVVKLIERVLLYETS